MRRLSFVCAVLTGLSGAALADPAPLVLATGDDYPPLTAKSLPEGGLASELVRRAFERSGHKVGELQWVPWKRAMESARRGAIDGTFPWGDTAERRKDLLFSAPFLPFAQHAWIRLGTGYLPKSKTDLPGRSYCNPAGYGDFGMITELLAEGALTRVTPKNMTAYFKMLFKGRIDMVIATPIEAEAAIAEAGVPIGAVSRSGLEVDNSPHHLVVGKSHPRGAEIIAAFDAGLAKLEASGELVKIKTRHGWRD